MMIADIKNKKRSYKLVLFYLLLVLKLNRIQTIMQKLNQQPDICPYFSPEFKVIPQYIIMKEGECMELNNRTTSFFYFYSFR